MLIIGICGASASGKSTLAKGIADMLGGRAQVISMDAYYKNHPELSMEQKRRLNYDVPEAFATDEFYNDILALRDGNPITTKGYDFATHSRADRDTLIMPHDVLILEGIHVFADPRLLSMMDIKFYVDVDADTCLARRVERDIVYRKRDVKDVCRQYLATVKPSFDKIIHHYKEHCDVCVMGGGENTVAIRMAAAYIDVLLNK